MQAAYKYTPEEYRAGIRKLGLSQKDYAKRIGVSQTTVSSWVNGRYPIPMWARHMLAILSETREKA